MNFKNGSFLTYGHIQLNHLSTKTDDRHFECYPHQDSNEQSFPTPKATSKACRKKKFVNMKFIISSRTDLIILSG